MDDNSIERCKRHRRRILEIATRVPAAHVAPAFSCLEIIDTLYHGIKRPGDTVIISKGHGYLAQLVVLEDLGVISKADLDAYGTAGGVYGAHPDYGTPGIAASTGALGHGLGIGVGMALADRDHMIYVVMSDGEMQEGSTWEVALVVKSLDVLNLCVLIDNNDFVSATRITEAHKGTYSIINKFEAFGWRAYGCNGHLNDSISTAINVYHGWPRAILCHTVKGKGISFMENNGIWHYRSPTAEEYELAMKELV